MVDVAVNVRGSASALKSEMEKAKSFIQNFYSSVQDTPSPSVVIDLSIRRETKIDEINNAIDSVKEKAAELQDSFAQFSKFEMNTEPVALYTERIGQLSEYFDALENKMQTISSPDISGFDVFIKSIDRMGEKINVAADPLRHLSDEILQLNYHFQQISQNMALAQPTTLIEKFKALGSTLGGVIGLFKQTDDELKQKPTDISNAEKALSRFGNSIGGIGKRLAWFGFRLTMIGRIFQRSLGKVIGKTVNVFKNWDKTIGDIAVGLGFLAASGMLTGKAQEMMVSAMTDLPAIGMQVQGVMAALQALFVNIGADVLPKLIPPILDLILALQQLWDANKGELMPIIDEIATKTLPEFIRIIKEVGPAFLEGLVKGINFGLQALGEFISFLQPHIGTIGEWLGILIGLAPVITAVGFGLFGLSVVLQTLSVIISGVIAAFNLVKTTIAAVNAITAEGGAIMKALTIVAEALHTSVGVVLIGSLAALIVIIVTVVAWFKEIWGLISNALLPAFGNLIDSIGRLITELFGGVDAWDLLRKATAPVAAVIMGVVAAFSIIIDIISSAIDTVTALIKLFKGDFSGAFKIVENAANHMGDTIDAIKNSVGGFVDQINKWFGHSIGDVMAEQYDVARESLEKLQDAQQMPAPYQSITIDMTNTFGNISSDVDVDRLTDEISRKIADKMERI